MIRFLPLLTLAGCSPVYAGTLWDSFDWERQTFRRGPSGEVFVAGDKVTDNEPSTCAVGTAQPNC